MIEVGRLADLAVLDRDPFTLPTAELHTVRTAQTYVGGVRVHGEG